MRTLALLTLGLALIGSTVSMACDGAHGGKKGTKSSTTTAPTTPQKPS